MKLTWDVRSVNPDGVATVVFPAMTTTTRFDADDAAGSVTVR